MLDSVPGPAGPAAAVARQRRKGLSVGGRRRLYLIIGTYRNAGVVLRGLEVSVARYPECSGRLSVRPGGWSLGYRALTRAGGGPRSEISGWSAGSSARNREFLQSVEWANMPDAGWALTLTLRDRPSVEEWGRMRRALFQALRRRGCTALHWVMEWQIRRVERLGLDVDVGGCPHFHLTVFGVASPVKVLEDWLRISSCYGSEMQAQNARLLKGSHAWGQYLAKHCSRTIAHAQRDDANMPADWLTSGRVWGWWGNWVLNRGFCVLLPTQSYYVFLRRLRRVKGCALSSRSAGGWDLAHVDLLRGLECIGGFGDSFVWSRHDEIVSSPWLHFDGVVRSDWMLYDVEMLPVGEAVFRHGFGGVGCGQRRQRVA